MTESIESGALVRIGPMFHGKTGEMLERGYGNMVFEYVGPTRHSYSSVIRELEYGTTWHVNNSRLTVIGDAS